MNKMATIVAVFVIFLPNFRSNARPLNRGLEENAWYIWIQNDLSFLNLFEICKLDGLWQVNNPKLLTLKYIKNHYLRMWNAKVVKKLLLFSAKLKRQFHVLDVPQFYTEFELLKGKEVRQVIFQTDFECKKYIIYATFFVTNY